MKLERLKLINFRGISHIGIEFDERARGIYGINGMGKSVVLEACNVLFSKILSEAAMDSRIGNCVISEKDVKVGETNTEIRGQILVGIKSYPYVIGIFESACVLSGRKWRYETLWSCES